MAQKDANFSYNPDTNYDEAIMAQQREIEKEIATTQSIIGDREDFSGLIKEYAQEDIIYQQKIHDLQSKYNHLRRTRGDGNCFYRAFGFSYFEKLLQDEEEFKRFKDFAVKSKEGLLRLGFPQFTLEDFHDVFMEVLDKVGAQCSVEDLLGVFNDQGYSDYLVVYLRLLVSGQLQKEEEFYANFIDGERTIKEFCGQEVEPMGKESDHIHITALSAASGVAIRVAYMDRGESSNVIIHDFPEGSQPNIHFLYRPGHYDILYP